VLESKQVYIFGYSGHAFVVIESMMALGFEIMGYFDYEEAKINPYQIPYLGFEKSVDVKRIVRNAFVFPTVGDNHIRMKIVQLFEEYELKECIVIDPTAAVSTTAQIAKSTYIGKQTAVNACAIIGKGVIVNTSAVVEHECQVADFVHLAPKSVLLGNVKVGKQTFCGANSVTKQGVTIGSHNTIGAGAVMLKSTQANETWVGVPAKCIQSNNNQK
jgi:sugar O-acyltransferase (sialic acid O-acetyltransferase NeuD family)